MERESGATDSPLSALTTPPSHLLPLYELLRPATLQESQASYETRAPPTYPTDP